MYVYFFSFIFILLGIYVWKKEKTFNPLSLFLIYWAIILFLSKINLLNYYSISDTTFLIVILGVFGFFFGAFFRSRYSFSFSFGNRVIKKKFLDLDSVRFRILYFIWLATTLPLLVRAVILLISGSTMKYLRSTYLEVGTSIVNNDLEYYLMTFFIKPFVFCITICCVLYIFNYGNAKKKIIAVLYNVIALVIISLITGGSRTDLINFAVALITGYFLFRYKELHKRITNRKQIKTQRTIAIVGISIGVIIFIYITAARASKYNLGTLAYNYLAGCMPYMSNVLQSGDLPQSYGFAFLNGFLRFIIAVLRSLGILAQNPAVYVDMASLTDSFSTYMYIGNGLIFNAFTTCFLYFYLDFRFLGVFFLSGLFGLFSMSVFKKAKNAENMYWSGLYLMSIFMIVFSMVRWQLFEPKYAFAFLYLRLFFKKKSEKYLAYEDGYLYK